jgi:hypothetical protein
MAQQCIKPAKNEIRSDGRNRFMSQSSQYVDPASRGNLKNCTSKVPRQAKQRADKRYSFAV